MAWSLPQNYPLTGSNIQTPSPNKKPLIQVLCPHRGTWSAEFVEAMWKPITMIPVDWCNKTFSLCRIPSLPNARNTLAAEFLKTDADYALWMDDDHTVEHPLTKVGENPDGTPIEVGDPNLALLHLYKSLVETGESIVTGLYRAKQFHGFNYAIWKEAEKPEGGMGFVHIQNWEPPEANFFSVSVCGFGFLLMHRRVLETMRDAGYGTKEKPFFHWELPGEMSEDFFFLTEAAKLGFKTWCLTDVKLSHQGELVVETTGQVRVPRV